MALHQAEGQQGRVPLVHVEGADVPVVELGQHLDSADAEESLLAEAVLFVAAVEVIGEGAVVLAVELRACIEQVDGNYVTGGADDVVAPAAQLDRTAFDGDRCYGI